MVPIVGSFLEKNLEAGPKESLRVATVSGFVVSFTRGDVEAAHLVQNSPDPKYSVYRLFLKPNAPLSIGMTATQWAEFDTTFDRMKSAAADSGASKRIEDTA
ncbi:MAG: hypothetical protein CTY20_02700 [Hyphomicrobium sp.]|nr:MAG: hypothetical protein CTY20_02700 [Hyphomicrobium sp.]